MTAQTTIQQLGGGEIFAMAFDRRHVVVNQAAQSVTLKVVHALVRGTAHKATHVVITLDPSDTYSVKLVRVSRSYEITDCAELSDVCGDQLKSTMESMTGLRLSL